MNKLIAILIAGTFALGSVAAMAQVPQGDKTPAAPVDQAKLKAEKDAAKAAKADESKMTAEEQRAARKERRAKKQQEAAQIEKVGQPNQPAKTEALQKSVQATKGDPKALATKEDKQKALKEQEKKASGQ